MKKSKIYLIVISLLIVIAAIVNFTRSNHSTLGDGSDFKIQDTSLVTKIFLADKRNNTVLLERGEAGRWIVNKSNLASDYSIDIFMKTIMNLEVKSPVSKEAHENMVKLLATNGTKVEIYQKAYRIDLFGKIKWFSYEKCVRTYYVGTSTQDNLGTYMLMEGSDTPYIMYIPGFNGYLTSRYSPLEIDWRDHSIYNYKYRDIRSVTLLFPETPEKAFKAVKTDQKSFQLFAGLNPYGPLNVQVPVFDTVKLMDLFGGFQDVRFEAIISDMAPQAKDSLLKAVPFHILTLETNDGKVRILKTYHMRGTPDAMDLDNRPVLWDRDRMFALVDNKDLVMIQFYVFDPLIRPIQYYTLPNQPE